MFVADIYFEHFTCTICILILFIPLYRRLPEDGDLSPKHLRGSYLWINYLKNCV